MKLKESKTCYNCVHCEEQIIKGFLIERIYTKEYTRSYCNLHKKEICRCDSYACIEAWNFVCDDWKGEKEA